MTRVGDRAHQTRISGDFNGDGRDDVALVGGPAWTSIVVAFSNGDGNFRLTNTANAAFSGFAPASGAKAVSGDFNGDGWSDIALVGGPWSDIKVADSAGGNGNFVNSPGPSPPSRRGRRRLEPPPFLATSMAMDEATSRSLVVRVGGRCRLP